jgi:hypothetical protein
MLKLSDNNIETMEKFIKASKPRKGLPKPEVVSVKCPGEFCLTGIAFMDTDYEMQMLSNSFYIVDDEEQCGKEMVDSAMASSLRYFDVLSVRFNVQEVNKKTKFHLEGYIEQEFNDRFCTSDIDMEEVYDCVRDNRAHPASYN